MEQSVNVFWFRRDLRLNDNAGLYHSLKEGNKVLPIFIFDTAILNKLTDRSDPRVQFIHDTVSSLNDELNTLGGGVLCLYGKPIEVFMQLINDYSIKAVYTNNDYEPYAIARDEAIRQFLFANNIEFYSFKDHLIFEKDEIVKENNEPYTVFTPYSRKWFSKLAEDRVGKDIVNSTYLKSYPSESLQHFFLNQSFNTIPTLISLGFSPTDNKIPSKTISNPIISHYERDRDYPGLGATSKLGIHLRFGTISIRELAGVALGLSLTYLKELIWRDFYSQILWHFPFVESRSFRSEYDNISWRNNEDEFKAWCEGKTGYPIVDAGMRELNATGFMHNRVRMVTASFLTKHLLNDWRWGETYFASKLLDYDLASNNGGWQWAAGSGTDAAPYFRIFNPHTQLLKFDPKHLYINKWIPEYGTDEYPNEIVEHSFARSRCLETYKQALNK